MPVDAFTQQLIDAGLVDDQAQLLAQQMKRGQGLMQTPGATGMNVGGTYVAGNPLEHLSVALSRMMGGRMANEAQQGLRAGIDTKRTARQAYAERQAGLPNLPSTEEMNAPAPAPQWTAPDLSGAPPPMVDGVTGTPAQRYAAAMDARHNLGTAGVLSGDPIISAGGQSILSQAQHEAEQALKEKHETVAERQAQTALLRQEAQDRYWQGLLGVRQQEAGTHAASAARPEYGVNPTTGQTYLKKPGASAAQPGGASTGPRLVAPPKPGAGPAAPAAPATAGDVGPLEPYDKRQDKMMTEFKKDMDAAAASSRSSFGESSRVVFRGARNLALLNQKNPDGSQKQLTEPEWQEVAGGLVAMQTGGVPTQEMMRHALPHDVRGDAASILSWLKSAPQAPDRQEWIERFTANIKREEETALKFQRDTQMQRLPSHSQFFSMFPNRAKLAAKGYGIDPKLVDEIRSGKFTGGADTGGGLPRMNSPAEARALPPGTHFLDANGVERVR